MRAQKIAVGRFVIAALLRHEFEEARHAGGIEARIGQQMHADAVGLLLVLQREGNRVLHRRGHAGRDRALHHLATARTSAGQDGREGCRAGQDVGLTAVGHAPRDVTLGDVRDFMGQHPGQFALVARQHHQPRVDADVAARQRKGVHPPVADREEQEGSPAAVLCDTSRWPSDCR